MLVMGKAGPVPAMQTEAMPSSAASGEAVLVPAVSEPGEGGKKPRAGRCWQWSGIACTSANSSSVLGFYVHFFKFSFL